MEAISEKHLPRPSLSVLNPTSSVLYLSMVSLVFDILEPISHCMVSQSYLITIDAHIVYLSISRDLHDQGRR